MKGASNIAPALAEWFSQDARHYPIRYFVLPIAVGLLVLWRGFEFNSFSPLLTGMVFFAGTMVALLFQVLGWASDAAATLEDGSHVDPYERGRAQRLIDAITRLYHTLTWATFVSLALVVTLMIFGEPPENETAGQSSTLVVAILGSHLLVLIVHIVNRISIVTRSSIQRHKRLANS